MEAELTQLESQIEQLIGLHEAGKAEVRELRARVAALEVDNRRLAEKVRLATGRIEAVLANLPGA